MDIADPQIAPNIYMVTGLMELLYMSIDRCTYGQMLVTASVPLRRKIYTILKHFQNNQILKQLFFYSLNVEPILFYI